VSAPQPWWLPDCLLPLWREWRLFILSWALQEVCPSHPDVPEIVSELAYWRTHRA
jgi:Trm5-related predicted tRNA methylase